MNAAHSQYIYSDSVRYIREILSGTALYRILDNSKQALEDLYADPKALFSVQLLWKGQLNNNSVMSVRQRLCVCTRLKSVSVRNT